MKASTDQQLFAVDATSRDRIRLALSLGKWATGFITGLILGLTLLNLAAARGQREIIVDFTAAPASAEDSYLLISCGDVPPASRGRC